MNTSRSAPTSGKGHDAASTVIIGAGPTGLSAAYHLGERSLLIEQNPTVGGWCRSIEEGGFTFDYAGHIMFSKDEYVLDLYKLLLGDNVHWQDREAWVFSKGVYTRYPFQGALYGLPPEVIKECIVGAIEARFGSLDGGEKKAPVPATPPSAKGLNGAGRANGHGNGKPDELTDCCADGSVEGGLALCELPDHGHEYRGEPRNFEEFIYRVWGKGIAKHFAVPYNRKLWAVPLNEMETSWLGGRVPLPDLEEVIEGALQPAPKPMGPNARFGYPLRGGFQALMNGFLPHLRGDMRLGTRVRAVSALRHELALDDGSIVPYEHLISTMPLPKLVAMLRGEAPRRGGLLRGGGRRLPV